MSQLFARVELRGTPGETIYEKLHAHMESLYWYQTIGSPQTVSLPHATYQATFPSDTPDVMAIANELKSVIESKIWVGALVLVIQSVNWAKTAG